MAVCFDVEGRTFRNELSARYKSNRLEVTPGDNPFTQMGDIKRGLKFLEIPWLEVNGVEADDVIGSLAHQLSANGRVYIMSMDHDMYQLIDERIRIYSRARGQDNEYGSEEIRAKYGIVPEQYIDYVALVGDRSDVIDGVPGIGAKTAAILLNKFGSIKGIYENLGEVRPKIVKMLLDERERVERNMTLARIRTDLDDASLMQDFTCRVTNDEKGLGIRDVMRAIGLMP